MIARGLGRFRWRSLALAGLLVALAGCGVADPSEEPVETRAPDTTAPASRPGGSVEVTVFAAASLRDALAAIKAAYEAEHPGVTISVASDSSAALRIQLEQGARADIFLSADVANAQRLVDAGLVDGPAVTFATNALALVVPVANPGAVGSPADLAGPGLKIVAAGDEVPVSGYVAALLASLAGLPGYGAGFADRYRANVVSREDNVRAILTKLELGEADAGFVYLTDAVATSGVRVVPLPEGVTVTARYAGVRLDRGSEPAEAARLFDWIVGPDGQAVLSGFGFGPPP